MTSNPSKNVWGKFAKTSKIGPSMETLNADFLKNFLPKPLKVLLCVAS